jgi:hypothetical protein
MNGKQMKRLRKEARRQREAWVRAHAGKPTITLRHRILFGALQLAARLGFPVKQETLMNVARKGVRLELRNA